ncbi:MAG: hypothetical protein M0Q87_09970 [Ottowia sp.]|nr:hypothetical protein [Ottowia sp.]
MHKTAEPFAALGVAAIIAAGVLGAALARRHSQQLVWAMSYLILVVGVGQYVLGAGQARLRPQTPTRGTVWGQWFLLNAGHAGVMVGTLCVKFALVAAATVPYGLAMLWFAWSVRGARKSALLVGYHALVLLLLLSSLVGLRLMWFISERGGF